MAKKKKKATTKDFYCLNCKQPFTGSERFCSECGQKNKGRHLKLYDFMREVFAGFFSWDAKFWRTLITLLFKPGKISKDYIEGKRVRYSNPFRFYLTASIIFFVVYGIREKYNNIVNINEINTTLNQSKIDSIKKNIKRELEAEAINIDSLAVNIDSIIDNATKKKKNITFIKDSKIDSFISYNSKHPNAKPKEAFKELGYEETFMNYFLFNRASLINSFLESDNRGKEFINKMLSYGSISLFILLPIFALFFKLYYFRHNYTYVDHLIFVFHTQTVFYILLTLITLTSIFGFGTVTKLFISVFPFYLFIALKKFYKQKNFKTFLKFCLLNLTYIFVISFGIVGVVILSLMLF